MIELIGVVAVIAILAALSAPSVIRQIDEAAWSRERTDLAGISNSLVLHVLNNKRIPTEATMAQAVADWTRQPVARITTNPRRNARAFLRDGDGWPAGISLPWTQTVAGAASPPTGMRLMIVSSTGQPLPVSSSSLSTTEFQAIWNSAERTKPSTWTTWTGRGEDLVVQRITLDPVFHHLVMINRDPPGGAYYAVNSNNTRSLTNEHRGFYLNGTDLGLYFGTTSPEKQMRVLLDQDRGFVFQGGKWSGLVGLDDTFSDVVGSEFAALAGQFLATEWYPNAHQGGNQQGAVITMFNFMLIYQLWANKCPHFPNYGVANTVVPDYVLMLDIAGGGESSLLNDFTGSGGLLK